MEHLPEVLKIIDGALGADRKKVIAYTTLLAEKLEQAGDQEAAQKVVRVMQGKTRPMALAGLAENGRRIPVDGESRLHLADERSFDTQEVEVFLAPEAQETVEEFLRHVQAAAKLLEHGIEVTASLLVFGPPGCGKTELARHIAAQLGLPLLTARIDSLISSYLGSTAKNIRLLFEHAMDRPCVLFLDELDALAKLRDDQHELGELKRVVISLLQNIDVLDRRTVILAATNHEHLLDPAVWRRFAYKVRMEPPTEEMRFRLFGRFLDSFSIPTQISLFAKVSDGLTGDEIRLIAEDSKRASVLAGRTSVTEADTLRRILRSKGLPISPTDTTTMQRAIRQIRDSNPRVFTYRRVGEILGISKSQVSNLLKDK